MSAVSVIRTQISYGVLAATTIGLLRRRLAGAGAIAGMAMLLATPCPAIHNPQKIKARLEEQGLDPSKFAGHLQAFDWGMPPHAGWGLGLERLLTTLIGIDNVREVVLYPRDPDRLTP